MGDFSLSASLHDLYVGINKDFSVSKEEKFGEDTDGDGVKDTIDESKFVEIHSMKAYLNMSIDVSLYGSGAAGQDNTIDMSEVLDLLLELLAPTANTGNSDFKVNITNELGRDDGAFLKLDLNAVIDFENWEAALSLKLQKYAAKSNSYSTLFGIYLLDDSIYVDLSGLLGETAKVKLEGVNVNSLIKNSLGIVSLLMILSVIALPTIKIAVLGLGLKLASGIIEPICDSNFSKMLHGVSTNLTLLIVSLVGVGFMFLLTVMLVIYTFNVGVI